MKDSKSGADMKKGCARITYVTGSSKACGAHVVFSETVKKSLLCFV